MRSDEEEKEGHDDLSQETAAKTVFAGAEIAVTVGGEAARHPAGLAGSDHP